MFTNMTLPALILDIAPGSFGQMEKRMSHYGALNVLYNNANALFGAAVIEAVRKQSWKREVKIPIFENYNHTVLTVRSCEINCQDNGIKLKTLTRTHLAIEVCINESDYEDNYVLAEQVLKHRYTMAKKALYSLIDSMGAAFFDANKDTTMVPDAGGATPNANPMFKAKAGAIEVPSSVKFYAFLQTIMEQKDIHGPFIDLANTVANAETNILANPGGGTSLATDKLMAGAQISEFEFSNRVAPGVMYPVHYVAPVGSVGIMNTIDGVYRNKPVLSSDDATAQWKQFENASNFKHYNQIPDEVYNDWNWGVLSERVCVDETILNKAKFSADFIMACDFTSVAGESPIKRIDIPALAA